MRQILIRHTEDITPDEAFSRAHRAWHEADEEKSGIVVFRDGIVVEFSDYSKHPSMMVFREKKERDNGLKMGHWILEESK